MNHLISGSQGQLWRQKQGDSLLGWRAENLIQHQVGGMGLKWGVMSGWIFIVSTLDLSVVYMEIRKAGSHGVVVVFGQGVVVK